MYGVQLNWRQLKIWNVELNSIEKKNRGTSSIQLNILILQLTVYKWDKWILLLICWGSTWVLCTHPSLVVPLHKPSPPKIKPILLSAPAPRFDWIQKVLYACLGNIHRVHRDRDEIRGEYLSSQLECTPAPAWGNFYIMMECTPESGRYHSVYSVEYITIKFVRKWCSLF